MSHLERYDPTDFATDELLECWKRIARAGCEVHIRPGADGLPRLFLRPPQGESPPPFAVEAAKRAKDILYDLIIELTAQTFGRPVPRLDKTTAELLLTLAAIGLRVRAEQWRAAGGRGDLPALARTQIDCALTKRA